MSILEVKKLQAGYAGHTVFCDIDVRIKKNKITTIIGPNGCGKSTLLKTMGRIIKPQKGEVLFDGRPLTHMNTMEIAKRLALLPQNPTAPAGLTAEELVRFGRFPHRMTGKDQMRRDEEAIRWAMEITKTTDFREREIAQLSGGERQRIWLAMVLAQETEVILLDEPTTYLDMVHQLEVLKIIQQLNLERQCSIVMVLHDINHAARFSHEIIAMKQGKIIADGTPAEVISTEVLRSVFNVEAKVLVQPIDGIPICYSYDTIPPEPVS